MPSCTFQIIVFDFPLQKRKKEMITTQSICCSNYRRRYTFLLNNGLKLCVMLIQTTGKYHMEHFLSREKKNGIGYHPCDSQSFAFHCVLKHASGTFNLNFHFTSNKSLREKSRNSICFRLCS